MPLELLRGSNLRVRMQIKKDDDTLVWIPVDCEVDCSLNISAATLDASCKGEFFDIVEPGRSSATGTINMIASDTKESNALFIMGKSIEAQLKGTKMKIEITQTEDDGDIISTPVRISGDAYITSNSWSFEDHQFVNNSIGFTFAGEVEHS